MILITIPDLLNHFARDLEQARILEGIQGSLPPVGAETRSATNLNTDDLLAQLEEADVQWQPQEEVLADGSTRYLYKRRAGEPDLSVAELESLLNSPPTFHQERQNIIGLLQHLRRAGVKVLISPTLKEGAAAEWDHKERTLRIQPRMIQKGSVDFLRVLSHEAIHVAQSCKAGSLDSLPTALGVHVANRTDILVKLKDPVYTDAPQWEKQLEKEAYASQNDLPAVKKHLAEQCKAA